MGQSFRINTLLILLLLLSLTISIFVNRFQLYHESMKWPIFLISIFLGLWAMGTLKKRNGLWLRFSAGTLFLSILPLFVLSKMAVTPNTLGTLFDLVKITLINALTGAFLGFIFWVPLLGLAMAFFRFSRSDAKSVDDGDRKENLPTAVFRLMGGQMVLNFCMFCLICIASNGHVAYELPMVGFIRFV